MIYIIEILDRRWVKVGFADNSVGRRIAELQTGSPFKLQEIIVTPGSIYQEKEIHKTITAALTRAGIPHPPNEWYPGKHPLIREFIENIKLGVGYALAQLDQKTAAMKQWSTTRGSRVGVSRWAS